ncbi:uncharacterized protein LOC141597096 [Silene latifolia]|uniref:uncharacterized protein LOC141597096 n=1 Tax=Silene latifolia TaxID=37657 RepID=UPI003D780AB6
MVEALLEQAAWLTPTSLFLLLNLVIATIVFSHRRTNHPDNNHNHDSTSAAAPPPYNPPQLARAPSLFSRVTSFNLSNYYPHPHHDHDQDKDQDRHDTVDTPPSFFSRVASFKLSGRADGPGPDESATPEPEPEPKMELKRAVVRSPSFLSRVASFTVGGRGFMQGEVCEVDAQCKEKGDDECKKVAEKVKKKKVVERVETASFRKNEEEVDAKADDFINRFKQQLKLQRIESLMRYRSA